MKNINTLVQDIYDVAEGKTIFDYDVAEGYCRELGSSVLESLRPRDQVARLRLSAMGDQCPRSLWHSVRAPSIQERIPGYVKIKFHYGHVIEALAIALAKQAGHTVTGEQDELDLLGVKGHRDCVIDGCVVDVKSLNSRSFQAVKNGAVEEDIFLRSYLDQLDGYTVASHDDPLVLTKDKAYLLAVDKVLGHMALYEHTVRPDRIRQRVADYQSIVASPEPPACTCGTVQERGTGNIRLDTKASYNGFKFGCFPDARCFVIKGKPVWYGKVYSRPDGYEIDKRELIGV